MTARISLTINGAARSVEADPATPLLWVLRERFGLTGTKFGCGRGLCGACTVHVDDLATRSCVTPIGILGARSITTIEGLAARGGAHVQQAWIDEQVPQCGYCQPGQIMTAAALLLRKPRPDDADIVTAMSGNLCRCGTYARIRRAVARAARTGRVR